VRAVRKPAVTRSHTPRESSDGEAN
jgi:hypothetical protein